MKEIKIEWCENFIRAAFKKIAPYGTGIERNCFFKMAEKAGLYTPGTYGTPISYALGNLTNIKTVSDDNGNFAYHAFVLK